MDDLESASLLENADEMSDVNVDEVTSLEEETHLETTEEADQAANEHTEIGEQSETVEHEEELGETNDSSAIPENRSTDRLIRLPLARIKNIMKTDPDVTITSQEAAILIAKATELFIQDLAREVFNFTSQVKRKTVQRKDLEQAIDRIDALAFLEGVFDSSG